MNARAPSRLYRQVLLRLPIIVALAFGLYSLVLVGYSVDSWRSLKQDANRFLIADSVRRAAALADRVEEIGREAALHADLNEIQVYLINRDLGMSPRYGLDASLAAIDERFKQHTNHSWSDSASRIVYVDPGGVRMADTEPDKPIPPLSNVAVSEYSLRLDADSGLLIALAPVSYKGSSEGVVVTVTPASVLYRNLITSSAASPYRELLLTPGGRELAGGGTGIPIAAELLRALAGAAQNTVLPVAELSSGNTNANFARALLVNTPVEGLPLQLVTLLPAEQAHGHLTSLGVLAAAALVPVLLLLGAIWFNRLSLAADKLQAEVLVAEQQRLAAERRAVEMGTEIRRRETLEEQLRKSEERWELAARGANDGIWDWNPQSGEVHYSDRWKEMLGYAPGDIGTEVQEWVQRIHPDDLHRTMAEIDRHQRGETEFYQCEHRLRCKDGSYKWILDRGKALFDAEGNAVRMSGSHTDITERHAAEARLRDRTEQLNAIFALSPDGFVSFDAEHRVKYANPAFFNMIALEETEILGLDEAALAKQLARVCTPGADLPGMDELRAIGEIEQNGALADAERSAPGGKRHVIETAGHGRRMLEVRLRVAQSETVSQILYFHDVTHETEVDRLKSEFLSTAAHELRTPMTNIYGFAELLLTREFDEADRHEYLGTIVEQSKRMVSIINELLDLVRIEERRGKDFDIKRVELRALLGDVVAGFKTPQDRPAPEGPPENGPLWVRADRGKLIQAISNVLSNAYKYSPPGSPVKIDLASFAGDGDKSARIRIRVTDRGIGMTPEQLHRVGERFYRADTSGKIPGTGLGMGIVREIVQLHRGELELESKIGEGTTACLWLPAEADAPPPAPPPLCAA